MFSFFKVENIRKFLVNDRNLMKTNVGFKGWASERNDRTRLTSATRDDLFLITRRLPTIPEQRQSNCQQPKYNHINKQREKRKMNSKFK